MTLNRRMVGIAILVMTLSACQNEDRAAQPLPSAATKPEVGVVTLSPQSVTITAELPGRTTAALVAEVRPQVDGIIQSRLFREGSEVAAGDALYQIDPASYQAAYDSAVANLAKAQASVPSAQSKVERYRGLSRQNAISKQELDDAVAALAQANAEVAAAEAAVQTAKINLDYTRITAPISGRVDASSLTPGALVTASQTTALTTIRQLDPINVYVTQSSTNLLNLRQAIREGRVRTSGDNVTVRLKLENGTIYEHPGKLEFAESSVSETTGTYTVRAEFPNPDRLLLPGMYVRAIVEEGVAENNFLVPQRGVSRNTKGEATALFVNGEGVVEERVIAVERSIGNNWLVDTGVMAGERVIVEGTQLVRVGGSATPVEVTIDETTGEVRDRQQQGEAGYTPATRLARRDDLPSETPAGARD